MAQASQAKLLRALQERAFRRLGGTRDIKVDVRVIAATNRSLETLVREGRYREDLYYRLSVIPITVPPLRDRPEDILALARHFLVLANRESRKLVKGFSPAAEQKLIAYSWPGNVRELRNAIERMVILTTGDLLEGRDVPVPPQAAEPVVSAVAPAELATLDEVERAHIRAVLAKVHGNRSAAARILGITRQTLRKKIGEPSTNG